MHYHKKDLLSAIAETGDLDDGRSQSLPEAVGAYKAQFSPSADVAVEVAVEAPEQDDATGGAADGQAGDDETQASSE